MKIWYLLLICMISVEQIQAAEKKAETVYGTIVRMPEIPILTKADQLLIEGAIEGDKEKIEEALRNGANINANRGSALRNAVMNDNAEIVLLLLYNRANPDVQDSIGLSPLMLAAEFGYIKIAHLLLNFGADPKLRSEFLDQNALDRAKQNHKKKMVEFLQKVTETLNIR
ncbi:MAG TPA: ankyrin repeat domain-containing protein [Candidatus Babeliales bacterium]|nr:ankyrin repeat domain-containing protein [Candidatus Babeliales bacterium]